MTFHSTFSILLMFVFGSYALHTERLCLSACAPHIVDVGDLAGKCTHGSTLGYCFSTNKNCKLQLLVWHACFITPECDKQLSKYEIRHDIPYHQHVRKTCKFVEDSAQCLMPYIELLQTPNGKILRDGHMFHDFRRMITSFTAEHSKSCKSKVEAIVTFDAGLTTADQFEDVMYA